jgi:hypothetical protein
MASPDALNGITNNMATMDINSNGTTKAKPETKWRKVDVVRSDTGAIIKSDVDILALRRFSKSAKNVLPRDNGTTNLDEPNFVYKMQPAGYNQPNDNAVVGLLEGFEKHKKRDHPPHIYAHEIGGSFITQVNFLAACLAFDVYISTKGLEEDLRNEIHDHPITKAELQALWQLLPDGHALIKAAVQALTYFYRTDQIEFEQNKEIEDYLFEDKDLEALLFEESKRQKHFGKKGGDGNTGKKGNGGEKNGVAKGEQKIARV